MRRGVSSRVAPGQIVPIPRPFRYNDGSWWGGSGYGERDHGEDFFRGERLLLTGLFKDRSCRRGCHADRSSVEIAGILLGSDFDHSDRAIDDSSADAGLAAIRGHGAGGGGGSGAGYVLPSNGRGLRPRHSFVRSADVFIAGRRRLPLCRHHAQYCFADSTYPCSLDRWMAPVSRSVARNRRGAGGHNDMAAREKNRVSAPVVVKQVLLSKSC